MKLTPHDVRRLAVLAVCDPKTVERYYAGRRVQSTSEQRIREAAAKLGLPVVPDVGGDRG